MNKFTSLVVLFLVVLTVSCEWSTKPYLEHEMEFKKIASNCAESEMKMTSNTNGERYVVKECLDEDFNKEKMTVERRGDSVVIDFRNTSSKKGFFEVTIDIDTYPRYKYLILGENTYVIGVGTY